MKYAVIAIALFAVTAASASSAGQFLPRAFFTLDAQGHQSDVHPVNSHLLRRLRRQVYGSSSSSSSSSSSNNGGGFYTFASHSVQNADGSGQAGSSYTQQAAPAGGVQFDSRFGEDSATGNYNSGAYNNGAYNAGSGGAYNTASAINTNAGLGSTSSYQQSYGTGAAPATQIHQTVSTFDANGNQKVTTIHGATDQSGVLNVQKTEANYSG